MGLPGQAQAMGVGVGVGGGGGGGGHTKGTRPVQSRTKNNNQYNKPTTTRSGWGYVTRTQPKGNGQHKEGKKGGVGGGHVQPTQEMHR